MILRGCNRAGHRGYRHGMNYFWGRGMAQITKEDWQTFVAAIRTGRQKLTRKTRMFHLCLRWHQARRRDLRCGGGYRRLGYPSKAQAALQSQKSYARHRRQLRGYYCVNEA